MASQEDDKLESSTNVNNNQDRNFINVYKKYEPILNNKNEEAAKKVECVIEIWKSIGEYDKKTPDILYLVQIMDWAILHTLNIVLTGKWKTVKGIYEKKLLEELANTENKLVKLNQEFLRKCQKLADVIRNPWSDPTLASLLNAKNATIGPKEIEFFCSETAYLISVRLKKLCESQCEDLALNLVTAFMNCYNLSLSLNFNLNATKTQILFCFDIHIALLYRYNQMSEILALFKKLSLEEGLDFIRRFSKKRIKISKVWRDFPEITFLASQVFVTAALTKPFEESGDILRDLLVTWIMFSIEHSLLEKLETSIRRIILAATAAEHIYLCGEIIYDKLCLGMRTLIIELYVRALTTDMNNLESQKTDNETDKFDKTTKRLAAGFFNLAEILKDNLETSRECALTGFSLEPTLERLRKIEDLARASGFNVLDTGQIWKCKLHPPVTQADELCWICNSCGDWMSKTNLEIRRQTNLALNAALNHMTLGISPQLCDDLVVVLNGPRYKLLNWLMNWEDLHKLCEMYLNDMERTKNIVKELKFLDIDYTIFQGIKREPLDELAGIEKGYEQYLYADANLGDVCQINSPESSQLRQQLYTATPPPASKSDPNTLRALRMFRPAEKRNKSQAQNLNSSSNNTLFSSSEFDCGFDQNDDLFRFQVANTENYSSFVERSPVVNNYKHFNSLNFQHPSSSSIEITPISHRYRNFTPQQSTSTYVETPPLNRGYRHFMSPMSKLSDDYTDRLVHYHLTNPESNHQSSTSSHTKTSDSKNCNNFQITNHNVSTSNSTSTSIVENSFLSTNFRETDNLNNSNLVPEKRIRLDETITTPLNNNQVTVTDDTETIQNENSSKNANCLPLKNVKVVTPKIGTTENTINNDDNLHSKDDNSDKSVDNQCKIENPIIENKNETNVSKPDVIELDTTEAVVVLNDEKCKNNENQRSCEKPAENGIEVNNENFETDNKLNNKNDLTKNKPNDKILCASTDNNKEKTNLKECMKTRLNKIMKRHEKENQRSNLNVVDIIRKNLSPGKKDSQQNLLSNLIKNLSDDQVPTILEKPKKQPKNINNNNNNNYNNQNNGDKMSKSQQILDKEVQVTVQKLTNAEIRRYIPNYNYIPKFNRSICAVHSGQKRKIGRTRKRCVCKDLDKTPNDGMNPRHNKKMNRYNLNLNQNKNIINNDNRPKDDHLTNNEIDWNPKVVLERLDNALIRSILSNIPGLNDYRMIQPSNVDQIVNVVQLTGNRTNTGNVPVQNTQTSTQITPHIQRIGQPRSEKPEHNSNNETQISSTSITTQTSTTTTTIKPNTSQPSTLINILSQQIIKPGQSNCVRTRSSPLINILSQQIIRPATSQSNKTNSNNNTVVATSESQVTTTVPKITTSEQSTSNDTLVKTVTATSTTTTTTTVKPCSNPAASSQGTILQFICKSSLPKFQQAFGKSVYQNNSETSDALNTCAESPLTNIDTNNKKSPTKNSPVNIQPIQGGVIYTRQMPVGQTINLIPPGRGQVFRIATSNSDQISLVKDSVIHSKMSALLAAALQGKQKTSDTHSDSETNEDVTNNTAKVVMSRPTLVQNARIVKPVLQIPSNVIRTSPQSSNLSSTTLEQLREFDMVYKQIKERSSTGTPSESNTSSDSNEKTQSISVTYLNQGQKYTQLSPVVVVSSYCNLQPAASPALSVTSQGSSSPCVTPAPTPSVPKVSSKSSKGKTVKNTSTTQASKSSPIPKPQQKPQEDEHTTQRIFDILAEYAEQLRNSPDLNNKPAPRRRSNPPTNPNQNSKRKKSSSSKKTGQCSSSMVTEADIEDHRTVGSEDSSCGVVQISVQEEEQSSSSHVQNVTTETTNDNNNTTTTNSRQQQLILTETGNNQTRNLIIADSSVGEALKIPNTAVLVPGNYIMPVSMVKGGQQIAVVSGGSKILATVPARSGPNMLLFQSFLNQNRKTGVPTVKYSTIQPISGLASQNLSSVSGQQQVILPQNSHNLTAVTLGQPITLKKLDETDRVNTELLLTISQPRDNQTSSAETIIPDSSSNTITSTVGNVELDETIINSDNSTDKNYHNYPKSIVTTPIATPVIAQTSCVKEDVVEDTSNASNSISLNLDSETNKNNSSKNLERVETVLVTACTPNGPMLSHTPPRHRKTTETNETNNDSAIKEEFLHNGEKQNNEQKHYHGNTSYFSNKNRKAQNPQRLDRELHQLQRKQAALERELRLQKSLSEECEDLGVDEPSTSDLFPEADILFDANHSPAFDQSSQDLVKRTPHDIKDDNKSSMTLFSDDDDSSTLRTDFLFESVEYQSTGNELEYVENQTLTNGQSNGSSCEDNTLLQNCASMSDVTINAPLSPNDPYNDNMSTSNKYKFKKYTNKRKRDKNKQTEVWHAEASSSEDTVGSTEMIKSSSRSPESCSNKHSQSAASGDDDLSDHNNYKSVKIAISKGDSLKDEGSSCDDDMMVGSPSGRGARRSVKKLCSCCNGSLQDTGTSRKRPASRSQTPAPHKKAFLNKKR